MEPSVQAYKVSLIGHFCVTLKVMSCLLVILLLWCVRYMSTGNQSQYNSQPVRGPFQISPTFLHHRIWYNTSNVVHLLHLLRCLSACTGIARKAWPGPLNCLLCPTTKIENDRDALIEQSNILVNQSLGQVVPHQLTDSGHASADLYLVV